MYNSRLTIYKLLKRTILLLLLAAFLLAGCLYAYTRDLSKGNNKIYVVPDEAVGQVTLTKAVVALQPFIPNHDYDGISLLLDHNRAAVAGTITVSIYRDADDTCVLTRTLPAMVVSGERYTYFASMETIPAEVGEVFHLTVTYNGPAAGVVAARTGEMSEAVTAACTVGDIPSAETMLLGIVTDYQNDPTNTRLLLAAFVLVTIALGALVLGWNSIKRNTGRGKVTFLAAYYGVITGLFLIALSMSATRTYEGIALGSPIVISEDDNKDSAAANQEGNGVFSAGDEWTLKDDSSLDAYITLPTDDICGISIPINLPQYVFTSESLTVQVLEPGTNRILQTAQYTLSDIERGEIYLLLDDRYDAGTQIGLHFITQGMSYVDAPGFYAADAGDSGNTVYYGGIKQEGLQITATLYRTGVIHQYTRPLAFYAVAVMIGLVLTYLLYRRRVPILTPHTAAYMTKSDHAPCPTVSATRSTAVGSSGAHRRAIAWLLFTIVFGIVVIDYAYAEGIAPTQNCIYPELVSYSADGVHDWEEIPTDEEIAQTFTVSNRSLSGVGLMIKSSESSELIDSIADCRIRVRIEVAEGEALDEIECAVGELEYVRQLLAADYPEELPQGFYYVPFYSDLDVTPGTELTLYISAAEENAGPILIAENPYDQVHLIVAYDSYNVLSEIYWPAMIIMFVTVIVLSLLAQRERISTMTICVGLAAITGALLSILIPPFCVPDERTHIKVIYYLSNQLAGQYDASGVNRLSIMAPDLDALFNDLEFITISRYDDLFAGLFHGQLNNGLLTTVKFNNAIQNASIWTYLPSLIGFQLTRGLGVTCITKFMAARWGNLVAALIMIYCGVRKCPIGRNGLMVVMLFPQLLQLIASCSYDAMIIAFSFLFVGNVLHLIYDEDRTALDYMVTLIAALLLGVNKYGIYIPVLCLILIPALQRLMRMNRQILIVCAVACVCIGAFMAISYASAITANTGSEIYSVADIIRDPLDFIHLLEHTLVVQGDTLIVNMIGNGLGPREVIVPTYIVAAVCVLLYSAWTSSSDDRGRIGRNASRYIGLLVLAGSLMICVAMTVGMTPLDDTVIKGLQGRYFLPYMVLACIAIGDAAPRWGTTSQHRIIYWMGFIHMVTIAMIFVSIFMVSPAAAI